MELNKVLDIVSGQKKGTYLTVVKKSDLGAGITKITTLKERIGVNAANTKAYSGGAPQQLPWGQWLLFPYLIEHTNKKGEYNVYLRLTSPTPDNPGQSEVVSNEYRDGNGNVITKDAALSMAPRYKPSKPSPFYTVNLNNILAINGIN